jgi:hypothetical protein
VVGAEVTENSFTFLFEQSGQVLWFDCPEGRPTCCNSVTCWQDVNGDESEVEDAFGPPNVDTVNTTFDAASGVSQTDPTTLYLTSTSNIVIGRQYVATNAYGEIERPIVQRINSGVSVSVRTPVSLDFAAADTFASARIETVLDSDWVADETNLSNPLAPFAQYRAVFVYTVALVTYRTAIFFDLVRYPYTHSVTPADVDRLSRGWLSRLDVNDSRGSGTEKIKEAFRQVKLDLWERTRTAYAQRNSEFVNELIRLKAVALVHEDAFLQGGIGRDVLDYSNKRYWDRLGNLFPNVPEQIAADGSTALIPNDRVYRR